MTQIKSGSLQDLSVLQFLGEEAGLNVPMPTCKRWLQKFKSEGLTRDAELAAVT